MFTSKNFLTLDIAKFQKNFAYVFSFSLGIYKVELLKQKYLDKFIWFSHDGLSLIEFSLINLYLFIIYSA